MDLKLWPQLPKEIWKSSKRLINFPTQKIKWIIPLYFTFLQITFSNYQLTFLLFDKFCTYKFLLDWNIFSCIKMIRPPSVFFIVPMQGFCYRLWLPYKKRRLRVKGILLSFSGECYNYFRHNKSGKNGCQRGWLLVHKHGSTKNKSFLRRYHVNQKANFSKRWFYCTNMSLAFLCINFQGVLIIRHFQNINEKHNFN